MAVHRMSAQRSFLTLHYPSRTSQLPISLLGNETCIKQHVNVNVNPLTWLFFLRTCYRIRLFYSWACPHLLIVAHSLFVNVNDNEEEEGEWIKIKDRMDERVSPQIHTHSQLILTEATTVCATSTANKGKRLFGVCVYVCKLLKGC